MLLVSDPAVDAALGLPEHEPILLLDDDVLDEHNRLAATFPDDPLENARTQLDGREGNVFLVNGREGRTVHGDRGEPYRLRVVNTANSRFMRVSFEGHPVWRIGGDHNFHLHGFVFQPLEVTFVDMDTPANNYTVAYPYLEKDTVRLDDTGREGQVTASGGAANAGGATSGGWMFHCHINEHSDRGMMSYLQVDDDLGRVPLAQGGEALGTAGPADAFSLAPSYPNPFGTRTTIRFTLPEQTDVSLRVYDLLGREVATLVSGERAAGVYEADWDATGLASGVYHYRLAAGTFSATRQMVVQR